MNHSLNKKWKEFVFAASGFGPNFLMVLMGAYFTNAMNPAAMGISQAEQTIAAGVCFITPTIFPLLYALSKAFDGIVDIPFAHFTDNLSTKWSPSNSSMFLTYGYFLCNVLDTNWWRRTTIT